MTNLPITNHLKTNIRKAKDLAESLQRNGVDPELILYTLLTYPSLGAEQIFSNCEIDIKLLQNSLAEEISKKKKSKTPSNHLTEKTKKLLLAAENISSENFNLDYICSEVMLLCFFADEFMPKCFKKFFNISSDKELCSLESVQKFFASTGIYIKDYEEEPSDKLEQENESDNFLDMFDNNEILSEFAENLNLKAAHGNFEKIVDFDGKINELTAILCRKKKPNAILVGGGGVGKSSIVESLALMIVRGEAPELLANKVIYSLNLSSMVAGTMYRGQFEERLKNFVDEIKKYSNIILFIDEIHTLVGAGGGSSSSLEASNALKPELARGTISCIGATTINEYTETIKKDAALDRRFERVLVREPSKFIMKQILPTIVSYYEEFHGVEYSKEFTDNVVEFCEKFLPNRFYPDKAVTVIDHCGAQAKVNFWETDDSIKESHQKIIFEINENGEIPSELFEELNKKLETWQERVMEEKPVVEIQHLKDFFEKKKNPLASFNICKEVSSYMRKEFVGQKKVIKDFFESINKVSIGLGKKNSNSSPDSYLFYGDKSSGKTLFSKTIKDGLEKNGASVIYYNGSQLSDHYAEYKIISQSNTNTTLCEKVVMNPNCIIIIDDFNSVSFNCINLFSQILKEGKLQMNNGDIADFSNCKFIFTCGVDNQKSMGFNSNERNSNADIDQDILALIEKSFLLTAPTKIDLRRIVYNRFKEIKTNLKYQDINFHFDFNLIKNIVDKVVCEDKCIDKLNSILEEEVINKISEKVLNGSQEISF
jgi:ATP-dependent Clp protease ATP-binding subunit ClpC